MTYDIWVRPQANGFVASALGLSDRIFEAPTRDQAIAKARSAIRDLFARGEIVRVELGDPPAAQEPAVGSATDDDAASWQSFLKTMEERRRH